MTLRIFFVSAVALVAVGACRPTRPAGPPTYPVSGKVTFRDGSPYAGGLIEFRSDTHNALSRIGDDGTFSLYTILDGRQVPGAVAGECRVTVTPILGGDQAAGGAPMPVSVTTPFVVKEGGNDFVVTLPVVNRP